MSFIMIEQKLKENEYTSKTHKWKYILSGGTED